MKLLKRKPSNLNKMECVSSSLGEKYFCLNNDQVDLFLGHLHKGWFWLREGGEVFCAGP